MCRLHFMTGFSLVVTLCLSGAQRATELPSIIQKDYGAISTLGQGPSQLAQKVDPWVLKALGDGDAEFIVFLGEQADLSPAGLSCPREERVAFVVGALREVAARTQPDVLAELNALGAETRPFWVANMIWVKGNSGVVERMARRRDVAHIFANPPVRMADPTGTPAAEGSHAADGVTWGLEQTRAPEVWSLGFRGQGMVVGGQDTGYRWNHQALKRHYRGWNGKKVDHNYSWHDAIHSGGGALCGHDSRVPCDDYGHGTHTMGTMVGDDGKGNQVGMAPGATWIGCRNMDRGVGTPASYSECFQWFLAPTNLNDQNPDPSRAPQVVNNSWGCPASEGCTDPTALLSVVQNVRAAGIVVVVSAGNSGPGCSTVNDPPAIYGEAFSVGATDSTDSIAPFSSRGPVTVDDSGRMKPDVSAPGVGVYSCTRDSKKSYGTMSGTSMAGPHVAGLVALVLSARPDMKGQVGAVEELVRQSALPLTTSDGCGADTPASVPNQTYGWGRVDALAAVQAALALPGGSENGAGEVGP